MRLSLTCFFPRPVVWAVLLTLGIACCAALPAPAWAAPLNGAPEVASLSSGRFLAMGGTGDSTLSSQADSGSGSEGQGPLEGSFLGALLFGQTFTGIGMVDILLLLSAAAALSLFARGKKDGGRDRFTIHRRDSLERQGGDAGTGERPLREEREPDQTPSAPQPRNGTIPPKWGRKAEHAARTARQREEDGHDGDPRAALKRNAAAQWGHFSSKGQAPQRPGAGIAPEGGSGVGGNVNLPDGFDAEDFLEGARTLYARLQQAWAARDVDSLAPFVTEKMLALLQKQAALDPNPTQVEVLLVNATLERLERNQDGEGAVVLFDVLMRAGRDEQTQLKEAWRFTRGGAGQGMWRLAGIEPRE